MSIKRITISVPSEVAGRIKKAAGRVPVSAWVTEVIEARLDDAALDEQWQRFYADVHPNAADAHVVLLARERSWPVLSSDADDLLRIDPTLRVERL